MVWLIRPYVAFSKTSTRLPEEGGQRSGRKPCGEPGGEGAPRLRQVSHFSYLRLYFERQIRCELLREAAPQSDPNIYLKSGVLLSLQEQPPQRVRFASHEKTPVLPAFRLPFRGTLHFRHQTRGFPPAERVPTAPAGAPRVSRALTLPTGDAATVPG